MDTKGLIDNFVRITIVHYADFNGRAALTQFWRYALALSLVAIVLWIVRIPFLPTVLALGLLLPTLGLGVRRLHDVGRSGWLFFLPAGPAFLTLFFFVFFYPLWALFGLATLGSLGYVIFFLVQPGTAGSNQYGPDPKAIP